MNNNGLFVVERLSHYYQWRRDAVGKAVELFSTSEKKLVGFRGLNELSENDWQLMNSLKLQLSDVAINSSLVELDNQPLLLVQEYDSHVVLRLLKNMGVAIASEAK